MTRSFSRKLSTLRKCVIRPLLNDCSSTNSFPGHVSDMRDVYSRFCHCFNQLTVVTTQNALGLNAWLHGSPSCALLLSCNLDQLLAQFVNYFECLSGAIVGGFFDVINSETAERMNRKRQSLFSITGEKNDALLSDLVPVQHFKSV